MKIDSTQINATKPLGLRFVKFIAIIFVLSFLGTGCGGLAQKSYPDPPMTLIDDSVPQTIKVAADSGWVASPGECLKLSKPGWHHQNIQGFPPSDYWMTYPYIDSSGSAWQAFSQHHIGHIIRSYPDKAAEDVGICPVCNGTGWVRKDNSNAKK